MAQTKKNDVPPINPIWAKFCSEQMESWLEWLRNIPIGSYLDMSERFIALNPYYVPPIGEHIEAAPVFTRLMINRDFIDSLSEKGILVWANSGFAEFIDALRPYTKHSREVRRVVDFFDIHLSWFRRVYGFLRAELIRDLREADRLA